tara:strand:+ start:1774 stop:2007 length:234 start_codon:yes stop_codon:yes gene_type:complete
MKTIQEAQALQRELSERMTSLGSDQEFLRLPEANAVLDILRGRLTVVNSLISHFDVYDWFFNADSGVKRIDIVEVRR